MPKSDFLPSQFSFQRFTPAIKARKSAHAVAPQKNIKPFAFGDRSILHVQAKVVSENTQVVLPVSQTKKREVNITKEIHGTEKRAPAMIPEMLSKNTGPALFEDVVRKETVAGSPFQKTISLKTKEAPVARSPQIVVIETNVVQIPTKKQNIAPVPDASISQPPASAPILSPIPLAEAEIKSSALSRTLPQKPAKIQPVAAPLRLVSEPEEEIIESDEPIAVADPYAQGMASIGEITTTAPQPASFPALKNMPSWGIVKELFKFASVSAVSFIVILGVMNFSAYSQMANYWFGKWKGEVNPQVANLQNLVDSDDSQVRLLQASGNDSIPFLPRAGGGLPSVHLDILPPDNRIVIPKIGKNVPIVDIADTNLIKQDWGALEQDIQAGLKNGVVRYPGTALPGQKGNFFVTGHSSFYFWENSKYKDIFALLPELEVGDEVTVYYNQKKYTYRMKEKKIVKPTDTEVLKQTDDRRITLMTCWPIGTDLNRIILVGEQIEGSGNR